MTKELTLPSGKIAKIENGKGYDLLQAQIKAKTPDEIPYALIAELTEKYGAEEVFKKLQEKGIINKTGQLNSDINMDDILGIQFIHIFNFDEFINESKNSNGQFKTEEDGFFQGVKNAIAQIASSLGKNPGGGDDLNGTNNSPQINSKLSKTLLFLTSLIFLFS